MAKKQLENQEQVTQVQQNENTQTLGKSKVGKRYQKIRFLESSKDSDQVTTFDLKGEFKIEFEITLPESTAKTLNLQTPYSGVKYEEIVK